MTAGKDSLDVRLGNNAVAMNDAPKAVPRQIGTGLVTGSKVGSGSVAGAGSASGTVGGAGNATGPGYGSGAGAGTGAGTGAGAGGGAGPAGGGKPGAKARPKVEARRSWLAMSDDDKNEKIVFYVATGTPWSRGRVYMVSPLGKILDSVGLKYAPPASHFIEKVPTTRGW